MTVKKHLNTGRADALWTSKQSICCPNLIHMFTVLEGTPSFVVERPRDPWDVLL